MCRDSDQGDTPDAQCARRARWGILVYLVKTGTKLDTSFYTIGYCVCLYMSEPLSVRLYGGLPALRIKGHVALTERHLQALGVARLIPDPLSQS